MRPGTRNTLEKVDTSLTSAGQWPYSLNVLRETPQLLGKALVIQLGNYSRTCKHAL